MLGYDSNSFNLGPVFQHARRSLRDCQCVEVMLLELSEVDVRCGEVLAS